MITGPTFEEMLHPQSLDAALRAEAVRALDGDSAQPAESLQHHLARTRMTRSSALCCPRR